MKLTGKNPSTRGKTCPSATLSTKNSSWTDQGSNPGLRGERPATNSLNHGTAGRELGYKHTFCQNVVCTNKLLLLIFPSKHNMLTCWSAKDRSSFFCVLSNCVSVAYDRLLFREHHAFVDRTAHRVTTAYFPAEIQTELLTMV